MMRKIFAAIGAAFLLCFAFTANAAQAPIELSSDRFVKQDVSEAAQKQLLAQMNLLTGAGGKIRASSAATYQGPGDIVSGWLAWGSCARVYSFSQASTATSLCDLVDSSTGSAVGTLRGTSSGLVDLSAYFSGSVTPATACASGCRVSKMYDAIGGSGWTNATNSQRPVITFSALNGLPGLTGTAAANSFLATSTTYTQALPYTWVAVAKRTANFTTKQYVMGAGSVLNNGFGFDASASTAMVTGNNANFNTLGSVADSSFHVLMGTLGTNCTIYADGASNTIAGCVSQAAFSGQGLRVMRSGPGNSMDGVFMEGGFLPIDPNSTQRSNLYNNVTSTNAYCSVNGCTLP